MADPNYLGNIAQAAARKKLTAGQRLTYRPGQGYYAAPAKVAAAAVTKPTAPFDYTKALMGEGILQGDNANIEADNVSAQAQRDNAVKALQFQFSDKANPFNALGEAERDRKETVANMMAQRIARGVSGSGGTTLQKMDIGHDFSKNIYDMTNQFNSQVGGLDSQLAETLRANALRKQDALRDATGRLIDNGVGLSAGGAQVGAGGAPGGGGPGGGPPPVGQVRFTQRSYAENGANGWTEENGAPPGPNVPKTNAEVGWTPAPAFDYSKIQGGYTDPQTGRRLKVQLDPWANGQLQAALANGEYNKVYANLQRRGLLRDVKLNREQLRAHLMRTP